MWGGQSEERLAVQPAREGDGPSPTTQGRKPDENWLRLSQERRTFSPLSLQSHFEGISRQLFFDPGQSARWKRAPHAVTTSNGRGSVECPPSPARLSVPACRR